MSDKTETHPGTCPTHGLVQGQRRMPRPAFPIVVYAVRRLFAARRPYLCPDCGTPVVAR
jgi:hypothetical protein